MSEIVRKRVRGGRASVGVLVALALILSLLPLVPAFAVPQVPPPGHYFLGKAFIAGAPAPAGTGITARIVGTTLEYPSVVDDLGRYGSQEPFLVVPGDDPDTPKDGAVAGDTIEFLIDGAEAALYEVATGMWWVAYPWHSGGTTNLDLYKLVDVDFGDAPDLPYPTLLASNGARHIVSGFFLGASVDAEPDGQPHPQAQGDDLAGLPDDEDGVVFTSSLTPGSQASVDVTASASGLLNAWLDFNGDGDWIDPGEQIFTNQALVAGLNSLTFPVPGAAVVGQAFARFRFDSGGGLSYEGLAPDGEVEDYQVEIVPPIDVDLSKVLVEPAGGLAFVGEEVWFQVLVQNTGQTAFTSNPFTDTFDEACMSFVSAEQDGVPVQGIGPGSPLQWDLVVVNNGAPIMPAQVVKIDLRFIALAPGICVNQASVTEFDEWLQQASDSAQAEVQIGELDFGDAPDPLYPTLLASNGARHVISGPFLGAAVDAEPDGQPHPQALGDDLVGVPDDEDGVVFTSSLVAGSLATVDVTASAAGLLNAWLDFNADGDWADPGEQIFANQPLVAGVNHLAFNVPAAAHIGDTFARFRFSSAGGLSYVGLASDGEVEDYMVAIVPPSIGVDLTKTLVQPVGRPAVVGEEVWFQVLVENTGQTAFVSNPFIDSFFDVCMSFVSAQQDGVAVPGVGPGSPLTWDLVVVNGGPIMPAQVVQIDLRFQALAPGLCLNEASVTEFDEWGQQASDSDQAEVQIVLSPSEPVAPLGADWNLLSTPIRLDAAHETLGQILPPETQANLQVAYGWDAANEQWVGPLSGTYPLFPLDAIFLKLAASGTAVFVPSEELTFPPSRNLVAGLNLIGPAPAFDGVGFPAMPLNQALVSIEFAPGGLRGYIMVISPGLNQPGWAYALGGTIRDLLPYKGYWVVMENPDTLYGFSMTPIGP